ncbi:MAG: class I SAM-dependent methyltransferase [Candidatus Micrarchaeota archaeon]
MGRVLERTDRIQHRIHQPPKRWEKTLREDICRHMPSDLWPSIPTTTMLTIALTLARPTSHFLWISGEEIAEIAIRMANQRDSPIWVRTTVEEYGGMKQTHSAITWSRRMKVAPEIGDMLGKVAMFMASERRNKRNMVELHGVIIESVLEMMETDRETMIDRLGLNRRRQANYERLTNTSGRVYDIGCEEGGLITIEQVRQPLVLVEKDPMMVMLLTEYAKRQGRDDVEIVPSDFREVQYQEQAYAVNINGVLHSLGINEIADAVTRLFGFVEKGGILQTVDADGWCCNHATPEKVVEIGNAIRRLGAERIEEYVETDQLPLWGKPFNMAYHRYVAWK